MCPICNNFNFNIVGFPKSEAKVKKILRNNYNVVKCVNCGFYFIDPKIDFSNSDWLVLYDSNYFPKLSPWYYNKRKKNGESRLNECNILANTKVTTFLDLGCGNGDILLESLKRNWQTYGLDITDNRVDEAKNKSIQFYLGSIFEAKYPDDFFDCVYMDSVLEHVVDPMNYLNELNRILKQGGILYIGVPNEDSLFNFFKKIALKILGRKEESSRLQPFVTPYHIGGFTAKSLKMAIKLSKFKIIKFRNFASKTDFLSYKFLSIQFLKSFFISIIYLYAVPLRKEIYFEVYLTKK